MYLNEALGKRPNFDSSSEQSIPSYVCPLTDWSKRRLKNFCEQLTPILGTSWQTFKDNKRKVYSLRFSSSISWQIWSRVIDHLVPISSIVGGVRGVVAPSAKLSIDLSRVLLSVFLNQAHVDGSTEVFWDGKNGWWISFSIRFLFSVSLSHTQASNRHIILLSYPTPFSM